MKTTMTHPVLEIHPTVETDKVTIPHQIIRFDEKSSKALHTKTANNVDGFLSSRNLNIYETCEVIRSNTFTKSKICRVLTYINEHLREDLTLSALARVANMSQYHFARRFKDVVGLTPHQYVIRARINRAQFLLRSSGLPISRVAEEVGFGTQSNFTTLFQRIALMTPMRYRQEPADPVSMRMLTKI